MRKITHDESAHGHHISRYLEDFVYGGIDGSVTTFAVVAGVQGASLASGIVVVLGFANLFADGFAMAVGNFWSTRARDLQFDRAEAREKWEMDNLPKMEREEIRDIYKRKGFEGELLEKVVDKICSNREVWLQTMMIDELGMMKDRKYPVYSALMTFVAFNMVGIIPLLPYVTGIIFHFDVQSYFPYSIAMTAIALGVVGYVKGWVVGISKIKAAFQTMLIGGVAAAVSYTVGHLLKSFAA